MANICDLTGKKAVSGNHVSFSNKKTKRKFNPNLQKKRFWVPEMNKFVTLKVSTKAIRTINKIGISKALEKAIDKGKI
jgi:large subunit ribosomal protein L28